MSELSIKVTIAGRSFPLTVKTEEEEEVRSAAAYINERVLALEKNFVVKDKVDLLAMLALELTLEKGHGKEGAGLKAAEGQIQSLIQTIDQSLATDA